MDVTPLPIAGALLIRLRKLGDDRGSFVKTFNRQLLADTPALAGFALEEEFYSTSARGVLRGLHFQLPPFDHGKLVYCIAGQVLDVFVDLRRGSATFQQHATVTLDAAEPAVLYLPSGLAHGFYTLSESATLVYKTDCGYAPEADTGVRWDSCGIAWPDPAPTLSERDQGFVPLADFQSPFA